MVFVVGRGKTMTYAVKEEKKKEANEERVSGRTRGRRPPTRLFLVAVCVSFGTSFNFGVQVTLTNPCQDAFIDFLDHSIRAHFNASLNENQLKLLWSGIVAVLFVGSILGALCLQRCAERLGRKRGLFVSFVLSLASFGLAILSFFINSFEVYAFSRVCTGFAIALSIGMAGIFLTECSPKECRGSVSMTMGVMMQLGTVSGSIIAMPQIFGNVEQWWLIYALESLPVLVILTLFSFFHETPSYLILHGREMAARRAIRFYYACSSGEQVERAFVEIKTDVKVRAKSLGMLQVFRASSGYDRQSVIVGCMMGLSVVFCGTAVISAYAVNIFHDSGLTVQQASIANVGLSTMTMVSCIISTFFIDRFGRRRLLLGMYSILLLLNLCIFMLLFLYDIFHYEWMTFGLIAMFCAFMFTFGMGPGPLSFFITTEMMGQSTRSAGQSWSYLVQMTSRTLVLATFLPMQSWLGPSWTYLIFFAPPILFAIIFFYFELPETKNRNIREVELEFQRLPTWRGTLNALLSSSSSSKATTRTFQINNAKVRPSSPLSRL